MLEDLQSSATAGGESERPAIVDDIIHHLTGIEFQPVKQSIREEDELALQKPVIPTYHNNEHNTTATTTAMATRATTPQG